MATTTVTTAAKLNLFPSMALHLATMAISALLVHLSADSNPVIAIIAQLAAALITMCETYLKTKTIDMTQVPVVETDLEKLVQELIALKASQSSTTATNA